MENGKEKMTDFKRKVLQVVRDIPKGKTFSYKQVAEKAGSPRASRAVGSIMKNNFDPHIPCHRVIRSSGALGEYNRGKDKKHTLLKEEGAL